MPAAPRDDLAVVRRDVLRYLRLIGAVIAALWLIEILDWVVFRGSLDTLGLEPRARRGLPGVVLHPLLHTGVAHLTANSVSFAIIGFMVLLRDERDFWMVSALPGWSAVSAPGCSATPATTSAPGASSSATSATCCSPAGSTATSER